MKQADEVMQQFDDFIDTCATGELETFVLQMTALTHSFVAEWHPKAWSVCELALLLSDGQASIERGFSVNMELVVENQFEQTLAPKRIIKDHIPC